MNDKNLYLYDRSMDKDSCGVGGIIDIFGKKSKKIVKDGLKILKNLEHRGAQGIDSKAGDGAGIMLEIPHKLFKSKLKTKLPDEEEYGVGMVFLPPNKKVAKKYKKYINQILVDENLELICWRKVPTNNKCLSKKMLYMEPKVEQFFIVNNKRKISEFERRLYIVRRVIEKKIKSLNEEEGKYFYISSLSASRIVYKGMFMASQLDQYYLDLKSKKVLSSFAIVHQRYSTNTFPSWGLAHPYHFLAHNGEINTIKGNKNWSNARECQLNSDLFGVELKKLFPIIEEGVSDSLAFDNTIELIVHAKRSIEHAMLLLIPQAWENDEYINSQLKSFYMYNQSMYEPWDGPAAIVFYDKGKLGAIMDRNGLRPLRYTVTIDNRFIIASETGVLEIPANKIKEKGQLGPGEMIMVDTNLSQILYDKDIKLKCAYEHSYKQWIEENVIKLTDLPMPAVQNLPVSTEIRYRQSVFGYTSEFLQLLMKPMAEKATEAIYAMGTDTPLAVLSKQQKSIFNYFKQTFAQVTNPAIDSIREEKVMSLQSIVAGSNNTLTDNSINCRVLVIEQPILTNAEFEQLKDYQDSSFRSGELSVCFDIKKTNLNEAITKLCKKSEEMVDNGYRLLLISDRDFRENVAPMPSLIAVASIHNYLIKKNKRGKVGIVVETGDAKEVHDFACLLGYGACAINPYMAFETIADMVIRNQLQGVDISKGQKNYIIAIQKGLKKIIAKMGISTLLGYQGAQLFEIIGLDEDIVNMCFSGTIVRVGGVGIQKLGEEIIQRHKFANKQKKLGRNVLVTGGEYNWRKQGEFHAYNPDTIHLVQQAAWHNDQKLYNQFKELVNNQLDNVWTIRSLLDFNYDKKSIPIKEVEPVEEIVKRFRGGAMSVGAISKEAHEDIAIAMNEIKAKSNSGEGGEDERRFKISPDNKLRRSAIKQVASGRFGVTMNYLLNADEIQIKIAQGAKPGEGGQLLGVKVDKYIAKLRHTVSGVSLISPPPHHDIYSIEDLSQLIFDLKCVNNTAKVSVKLASESGIGPVAAGVTKAKADGIVIAGYEGGTGASPATSIKHTGTPWELGLAETQQSLVQNNLRNNVRLQVDGQLKTGRDVVIAALLGAEEFGFATIVLITLGCIMVRKCHLNTCPVGITTQNKDLREKYSGRAEYIYNYLYFVGNEIREIMAKLGYKKFDQLIGQTQRLKQRQEIIDKRGLNIDLSSMLRKPKSEMGVFRQKDTHSSMLDGILDKKLYNQCKESINSNKPIIIKEKIKNYNRTVGTYLGSKIVLKHGNKGLKDDHVTINLSGTAGQSFGAFIPKGLTLELIGDTNDYVGKGLSGGKIIIYPPKNAIYPHKSSIAGNTCLYGATSGKVFISGTVGQRFAIRNSGATAVVEGVGDHCCEYMTGGCVVILGSVGKNFAAGMSGGIAFVYDNKQNFKRYCNYDMVEVEKINDKRYVDQLFNLINEHYQLTNSRIACNIIEHFNRRLSDFAMVIPNEYRKILAA